MLLAGKYKIIVRCKIDHNYYEIIQWLNNNSSGSIKTEIILLPKDDPQMWHSEEEKILLVAFENTDDALLFKIRYST